MFKNLTPKMIGCFLSPCVLATVALVQIAIALQTPLSPWKGGGFGMFSDIQQPANRSVLAWVRINGKVSPARIPSWLERQEKAIWAMPTPERLAVLAEMLAQLNWGAPTQEDPQANATSARGTNAYRDDDILIAVAFEVEYVADPATGQRRIQSRQLCRVTKPLNPAEVPRGR